MGSKQILALAILTLIVTLVPGGVMASNASRVGRWQTAILSKRRLGRRHDSYIAGNEVIEVTDPELVSP